VTKKEKRRSNAGGGGGASCRLETESRVRVEHTASREGAALRADERIVRWVDEHAHVPGEGLGPRRRDDAARNAADAAPQRHAGDQALSRRKRSVCWCW
jgi:hypothetical protein